MRLKEFEELLDKASFNGYKMRAVSLVNHARGGGLKESKELVDTYFGEDKFGKRIINSLRASEDWLWKIYKYHIRNMDKTTFI
jgi:hypothetical protein